MRVFVESNFVLELVLQQGEVAAAERILFLAERGKIRLCIPAFSLVEPYHSLIRDRNEREPLKVALEKQVDNIARSANFANVRTQSVALLEALVRKADTDLNTLYELIVRISNCAAVLPLTGEVMKRAVAWLENDLKLPDAIVLESVLADLNSGQTGDSIFANRNSKDFMQPSVKDVLQARNCRVISIFTGALAYIERQSDREAGKD